MNIAANLKKVQEKIKKACERVGRSPAEIKLVAVSKNKPAHLIKEAIQNGIKYIGENYVQEALKKYTAVKGKAEWHFIGHLQTNKVKYIIDKFSMIETVDSEKLAKEINRRAEKIKKRMPILIEVNLEKEETKSGVFEENLKDLIVKIKDLPYLSIQGLMTIPPFLDDPEKIRPYFKKLSSLREELQKSFPQTSFNELSMGMTGDFEAAIEEGATIVRIGTAIFGERV